MPRLKKAELIEGEYVSLPAENGGLKSRVVPGLWLDTEALVGGQPARVLAQLRLGLESPEYAAFAAGLSARLG